MSDGVSPQTAGSRYDAFLSYHWRDRAQVEDLARALRAQGLHVFLDRWYLRPGHSWPQELAAVLRECRAVVVCVGPGEMGNWQQREADLALQRHVQEAGFPVIPVLLRGAEPALGFLGQHTWVDFRAAPDDPVLLAILAAAIRGEPPGPDARDHVARTLAAVCPYRGLLYFREEDAPFLCGREVAVARLVEAVGRGPLVAVVGASGCGKSSVVRAGLVPALRRDGTQVWDIVTIVPGARPLHALAAGLLPLLEPEMSEVDRLIEVNKLAAALEAGEVHLTEIAARVVAKQAGTDRLLLVADQWEELYTSTPDEGIRRRFIDELLAATTAASPVTVVLTLRGDFVGHALAYRSLADRLQGAQVNLGPMVREELQRAVEQPAAKVGLRFESGLVDRILDDAGDEPGNLPLLEFVLRQLWERRQHGGFQHEAYEDLGRLQGAVAKKADEVFGRLSALEQQAVQRVFLRLATLTEGGDYMRRRALQSELEPGALDIVKKLADERLLVIAPGATGADEATVEVSHEAFLRRWERLKAWLDGHRAFLLWRGRFAALVATWRAGGRHSDALATGMFLGEAEWWQREQGDQLSPEEHEYIAASVNRRRQVAEAEQARVARELAQARALADAEAERAREAEARRTLEAERANLVAADRRLRSEAEAAADEWERSGRAASRLWPHERLVRVHEALARLGVDPATLPEPVASFLRPEAERLLEELERPETSHTRRAEIGDRLDGIGDPRPGVGLRPDGLPDIDWCEIPAGAVTLYGVAGRFMVAAFLIAKYPVTYRQYKAFLDDPAGYRDQRWWEGPQRHAEPGEQDRPTGNCPAENVSWYDAMAYCCWLSARLGYEVRPPTEQEWQQAATGGNPRNEYPWGGWVDGKANTHESRLSRTTAVGMYPGGASPQGVLDLAGNVWEWCLTDYDRPGETRLTLVERSSRPRGARSEIEGRAEVRRVVRGGSWYGSRGRACSAYRYDGHPANRHDLIGFRVVRGSPIL